MNFIKLIKDFTKNNILHIIIILLLCIIIFYSYKNNKSSYLSEMDDILANDIKKNELKTNIIIKDFHLRKNDEASNLLLSFVYNINTPYQSIINVFDIEEFIANYKMNDKMYNETDGEGKIENVLRDILHKLKQKYSNNKQLKEISGVIKIKIHDENIKRYHGKTLDNDIYYTTASIEVN